MCVCDVHMTQAIYSMVGAGGGNAANGSASTDDTPEERTKEIFAKMDENRDGVLTKDEFIKGCMSDKFLYQMLTADPSGGVSDGTQ